MLRARPRRIPSRRTPLTASAPNASASPPSPASPESDFLPAAHSAPTRRPAPAQTGSLPRPSFGFASAPARRATSSQLFFSNCLCLPAAQRSSGRRSCSVVFLCLDLRSMLCPSFLLLSSFFLRLCLCAAGGSASRSRKVFIFSDLALTR